MRHHNIFLLLFVAVIGIHDGLSLSLDPGKYRTKCLTALILGPAGRPRGGGNSTLLHRYCASADYLRAK